MTAQRAARIDLNAAAKRSRGRVDVADLEQSGIHLSRAGER